MNLARCSRLSSRLLHNGKGRPLTFTAVQTRVRNVLPVACLTNSFSLYLLQLPPYIYALLPQDHRLYEIKRYLGRSLPLDMRRRPPARLLQAILSRQTQPQAAVQRR